MKLLVSGSSSVAMASPPPPSPTSGAAAAPPPTAAAPADPDPKTQHYSQVSGMFCRTISMDSPAPVPTTPPRPSSPPHIYEDVAVLETAQRQPLSPEATDLVEMIHEMWQEYQGRRYGWAGVSTSDEDE